jgi:imidazolonepropionase-like amidohydrolase
MRTWAFGWFTTILVAGSGSPIGGPSAGAAQERSPGVAFVGVSVVTMEDDRVLPNQTVLVRGGRIVGLGPAARIRIPEGATRIDGKGRFLIPGLADMHVHFSSPGLSPGGADSLLDESLLRLYLANGVTTVLNLHGRPEHARMRDRVARGELLGPTIYTAGPVVNDSTLTFADGERIAAEYRSAGYDAVKVYNFLSRDGYLGITSAAKRVGIPAIGHIVRGLDAGLTRCEPSKVICHCPGCLEKTLRSGQIGIVHIEEVMYTELDHHPTKNPRDMTELEPRIDSIARRIAAAGVWVTPTLEAYKSITRQIEDLDAALAEPEVRYVPERGRTAWGRPQNSYLKRYRPEDAAAFWRAYALQEKMVVGFHRAGVRLMTGTDVGLPTIVAGFSLHGDLQDMVKAGLSPYQALQAGTANPGRFAREVLHRSDPVGTVTVGSRADLVLLDANPLEDVTRSRKINGVMVRGRWLDRSALDRILEELARNAPAHP